MGYTAKVSFPEQEVSGQVEDTSGPSATVHNSFTPGTTIKPNSLLFLGVNTSDLDLNLRPRIIEFAENPGEIPSNANLNQVRENILYIGPDSNDQPVPDNWRNHYLALTYSSGHVILVRTYLRPWIREYEAVGHGTSQFAASGYGASYEYTIAAGEITTDFEGPVAWIKISEAEYLAGIVPSAVHPSSTLAAFVAYGDLQPGSSQLDIELLPGDDPSTITQTVRFVFRYDKRIVNRSSFQYDGEQYNVGRFDTDRKRFLTLGGSREIQQVVNDG